ncbi:Hypothetical protein D9617_152g012060 [Elsinoe fawcettii]|nr:Hypothetical protein D9617_152g012060 [Elsinoe fawcettii]
MSSGTRAQRRRGQFTSDSAPSAPQRTDNAIDVLPACKRCMKRNSALAVDQTAVRRSDDDCFRVSGGRVNCWLCSDQNKSCDFYPTTKSAQFSAVLTARNALYARRRNGAAESSLSAERAAVTNAQADLDSTRRASGSASSARRGAADSEVSDLLTEIRDSNLEIRDLLTTAVSHLADIAERGERDDFDDE